MGYRTGGVPTTSISARLFATGATFVLAFTSLACESSVSPLSLAEDSPPATPAPTGSAPDAAPTTDAREWTINAVAFEFHADPFEIRDLTPRESPFYSDTVISLEDRRPHDASGVRMFERGGVLYDHPVAQAQYALQLLNSYRLNGDEAFLDRAELQAQRLIGRKVLSRNAWYYPYPMDAGSGEDFLTAPWYSGMAQGLALGVFVWLAELTDKPIYELAAAMTFNSFTNDRSDSDPWVVWVDDDGYLWLEEYPRARPDRTINGKFFAAFGLTEYFRFSGEPGAKHLIQGAFTTLRHYLPTIRTGWVSLKGLSRGERNGYYHLVVTGQLQKTYTITGHPDFADWTELFVDDYPDYRIGGTVRFEAGTHTGYAIDDEGGISEERTLTISKPSWATAKSRRTLLDHSGVWFEIVDGGFAGYYLPEIPGHSYIPGKLGQVIRYSPPRSVWLSPGSHTGYRFADDGATIAMTTIHLDATLEVQTSERAVINGETYRLLTDGELAGYWIPADAVSTSFGEDTGRIGAAD